MNKKMNQRFTLLAILFLSLAAQCGATDSSLRVEVSHTNYGVSYQQRELSSNDGGDDGGDDAASSGDGHDEEGEEVEDEDAHEEGEEDEAMDEDAYELSSPYATTSTKSSNAQSWGVGAMVACVMGAAITARKRNRTDRNNNDLTEGFYVQHEMATVSSIKSALSRGPNMMKAKFNSGNLAVDSDDGSVHAPRNESIMRNDGVVV
mmetsp:Transcript_544/g.1140  ORF Transcript_544/g.1140 Transcript_544/m.1140 type:complete len:205 (+) Transcript_544:79-693(+)